MSVVPDAKIILYGSRARGDARPDSDWDFLVLTPVEPSRETVRAIRSRVFQAQLSVGAVVCLVIRSIAAWESPLARASPFHRNVRQEGVAA